MKRRTPSQSRSISSGTAKSIPDAGPTRVPLDLRAPALADSEVSEREPRTIAAAAGMRVAPVNGDAGAEPGVEAGGGDLGGHARVRPLLRPLPRERDAAARPARARHERGARADRPARR